MVVLDAQVKALTVDWSGAASKVEAGDVPDRFRHGEGDQPGPAGDVEHASVGLKPGRLTDEADDVGVGVTQQSPVTFDSDSANG